MERSPVTEFLSSACSQDRTSSEKETIDDKNRTFEEDDHTSPIPKALDHGEKIHIQQETQGDLNILGGKVKISAPIQGNLTIAGDRIILENDVAGDAFLMGEKVYIDPEAELKGNVEILAERVSVKGSVKKDLHIKAEHIYLDSLVSEDSFLDAPTIILGQHTILKGNLETRKNCELKISPKAHVEGKQMFLNDGKDKTIFPFLKHVVSFMEQNGVKLDVSRYFQLSQPIFQNFLFGIGWISSILLMFVMYRLFPQGIENLTRQALDRPMQTVFSGLFGIIVFSFSCFFVGLTIIGIPLALVIFLIFLALLSLSHVIGTWILSQSILPYTSLRRKGGMTPFFFFMGVAFLLSNAGLIPGFYLISIFLSFVLALFGLGALLLKIFFGYLPDKEIVID